MREQLRLNLYGINECPLAPAHSQSNPTDRKTNKSERQKDRWTVDGLKYRQTNGWTNLWTDWQAGMQANRQLGRWEDRRIKVWTDKQTKE